VDVSSPSSSNYASVEDLGPPEEVAKRTLDQYLEELMSTRIGVRRSGEVLSSNKRIGPDGKEYYDIQVHPHEATSVCKAHADFTTLNLEQASAAACDAHVILIRSIIADPDVDSLKMLSRYEQTHHCICSMCHCCMPGESAVICITQSAVSISRGKKCRAGAGVGAEIPHSPGSRQQEAISVQAPDSRQHF
jgi:hypothetical protein